MSRESKPFLRRRHAAQLFKTEICKFFLEGRCESGEACSYAHEEEEVRNKPDLTRTSMCRNLIRDGACNNKRCRFAHSEEELRATNGFFKMKMCLFAQSGKCKSGSRCRFAHTTDELRPARLCEEEALDPDAVPAEQEQRMEQESQIDLYSLSSFPERQKSSQQESHGTGGSTATGNSGSTSGNGGSTSGNASGQSSNENSGSGHSPRGKEASESRPRARALQQARMRKENVNSDKSDESSCASGNSSATVVPRSEHGSTASPPASDSSSSGACGNGERTEASGHSQPGETKEETTKVSRRPQSKRRGNASADKSFEEVTTLIISNLPLYLTQGALLSFFQDLTTNMRGKFDFFYSPWDHEAGHSFGYCVINFTDEEQAGRFYHQWTNKDIFGSGRGPKPHPPLKVAKASLQGLQKNIDYFCKAGIGRCPDVRFCPLYRDAEGNMKHFELAGDVESQPAKDGTVQPKAFQEGLGPQDLDTGQETVTGAAASKGEGASCEPATSGASRPEEHNLQAREEATTRRPRRRNNRRRSKENQEKETVTAPEAAQVPPAEFPAARHPQRRAMPGSGVQPDMRQLALRQQQQQLLKDLEEKEERKRNKNQNSQETSSGPSQNGMIPEMLKSPQLHEAQQLQMLLMQLQQFQSSAQQMIGSCSAMTSCMNDTFPQAAMTPSTAPGQFMVSRVPMGVRDSGQLAMHMARQVNQLPVNEQVASNYTPDQPPGVAGLPCANAPMGPIVPCVMLPVQSMPVQSLQAPAPPMAASGSFNGSGGLRLLNGDEVYTD